MAAIKRGDAPNYAFLSYGPDTFDVRSLFVVPGHFLVPSVIQRRNPLRATAKRAGWVGSNIVLGDMPPDARVAVVSDGRALAPRDVRREFQRFEFLNALPADSRGWTADVLACVRRIGRDEFTMDDAYAFESELGEKHPANRNVRPKIRQQLQVLVARGVLRRKGRGEYRVAVRDGI
ncbi:MAG: DpnI domain-containing protein, partial [Thermoplasmatota archaeon]